MSGNRPRASPTRGKSAAFYRKTAAELIQRLPEVVEPIRDGRLCFSTVVELAKVRTPENREEMLPRFFHCSKQEAKAVSAAIKPDEAAPHRTVVTVVRAPAAAQALPLDVAPVLGSGDRQPSLVHPEEPHGSSEGLVRLEEPHGECIPPGPPPLARPVDAFTARPVSADLARLNITVPVRLLKKLEKARAAVSHSHPGATEQEILEAGLDLLIDRHERAKGIVEKPRRTPPPSKADHVPAHVKREVWKRDEGKCQWPVEGGGICGSTHRVEFDHVVPRGKEGPSTVENVRVLCRVHNQCAARKEYGDAWMDRFTRGARVGESRGPPGDG